MIFNQPLTTETRGQSGTRQDLTPPGRAEAHSGKCWQENSTLALGSCIPGAFGSRLAGKTARLGLWMWKGSTSKCQMGSGSFQSHPEEETQRNSSNPLEWLSETPPLEQPIGCGSWHSQTGPLESTVNKIHLRGKPKGIQLSHNNASPSALDSDRWTHSPPQDPASLVIRKYLHQ